MSHELLTHNYFIFVKVFARTKMKMTKRAVEGRWDVAEILDSIHLGDLYAKISAVKCDISTKNICMKM
jgi:hypothetical protein